MGGSLFFLEHPRAGALFSSAPGSHSCSAWKQFRNDGPDWRFYNCDDEMEFPSNLASLGEVGSVSEFIYIFSALRQASSPRD